MIPTEVIEKRIFMIRGQKVILDSDLAQLYGVAVRRLNEQVKRNKERFPEDFMFQLTTDEKAEVVAICDHLKQLKFSHVNPYAFTEHGAIMAATVLNSPNAVQMSVFVVRAFVKMREQLMATAVLGKRLAEIEKMLLTHDTALRDLYRKIRPLLTGLPMKSSLSARWWLSPNLQT